MSLRYRLALVFAALTAVATGVTALVIYTSARDRLMGEINDSLVERSTGVAVWSSQAGEGLPAPPDGVGSPLHYDSEIQILDRNGVVTSRPGEIALPVDEPDRDVAAGGRRGPVVRDVTVGGVVYRMRTTPLAAGGASQVARDTRETQRVLAALRIRVVLIGLSVVITATLIGWLLARRIVRPIERLAAASEHVTRTGDLDKPVTSDRRDETGRLARSFSSMLAALSRSREQQQQLAQDAGHELRTPLTSVRTNVDILARHPNLSDTERAAILADLREELGEISGLVDELVRLAGDEHSSMPMERVALDDVIERTVARAERRYGRRIIVTGRGDVVQGRPVALERAVGNLIDNAVKFSPNGMPVDVTVTGGAISVRDHGMGVDPADVPRIFDRFARAESARALPGSGLGLAIVRQVAESHGGSVFARTHADGGAVVGFALPSSTSTPAADAPPAVATRW